MGYRFTEDGREVCTDCGADVTTARYHRACGARDDLGVADGK